MERLRSESQKNSRLRAIAIGLGMSLGRLTISGTICALGLFALQVSDRNLGNEEATKEIRSRSLSSSLVSWVGMSLAFWSWEEYFACKRKRETREWRDRLQYFQNHLREREQQNLELQGRLDSDRQQWENIITSYQKQLSEQIQQQQEIVRELEQTRKVVREVEERSAIDEILEANQHLEAKNAELLHNIAAFKGRIEQLQKALNNYSNENRFSENIQNNAKRSIPLSQLTGLSSRKVIHAFQRLGFSCDRQKGSHVTLKKHVNCVIPIKTELAPGTLKNALQQANISLEEFLEHL